VSHCNFVNNSIGIVSDGLANVVTVDETMFHGYNRSIYMADGFLTIVNSTFKQEVLKPTFISPYLQTINSKITIVNSAFFVSDHISFFNGNFTFYDSFFTSNDDHYYLKLSISQSSNIQTKHLSLSNIDLIIEQTDTMQLEAIVENSNIYITNQTTTDETLFLQVSELTNTSLYVEKVSLGIFNSNLYSSTILASNESTTLLGSTVIRSLDNIVSVDDSSIITLRNGSYLEVFNSTMDETSIANSIWVDCDSSSWVTGDFLGWKLSPQCNLKYETPLLTDTDPVIIILPSGNTEMIGLVLPPQYGGVKLFFSSPAASLQSTTHSDRLVRITVDDDEDSSLQNPVQQNFINMFLVKSACGVDLVAQSSSSISVQIPATQKDASLSFDGPAPSFLQPNKTQQTTYCLLINASSHFPEGVLALRAEFLPRRLALIDISLSPSWSLYSTHLTLQYSMFDEWGSDYINEFVTVPITSANCANGTCGETYPQVSAGTLFIELHNVSTWKVVTRVNVQLNGFSSEAVGTLVIELFILN